MNQGKQISKRDAQICYNQLRVEACYHYRGCSLLLPELNMSKLFGSRNTMNVDVLVKKLHEWLCRYYDELYNIC